MLKLDRLVLRLTLTAFLCAALTRPIWAQSASPGPQSISTALLSQGAFGALNARAKSIYLMGVTAQWQTFGKGESFAFLQAAVDSVVSPQGDLRLPPGDALPFGRAILLCFRVSGDPRFLHAAKQLRDSLQPQQDKADTAVTPFLADFGVTTNDASAAEQAAAVLLRVDISDRDLETGLLRKVDLSRNTLYAMDLLETINRLPIGFHHRRGLTEALNKTISALVARSGDHAVWQTPDQPQEILLLNAYIVARAVRFGELAESDSALAQGMADLAHSQPLTPSSAGAGMLAESEADQVATQAFGQGKTVLADAWFVTGSRTIPTGEAAVPPSKWADETDLGLSSFGYALERYGMRLDALRAAPTSGTLSSAQILVIASSRPQTHEVASQDADSVEAWVKDGGVLVLLNASSQGYESSWLNTLSDRFGMHFLPDAGATSEASKVQILPASNVFTSSHRLFLPAGTTLTLSAAAHAVLKNGDAVEMAVASVGRGTVLTIANPWICNGYLDGRKASVQPGNLGPAIELAGWLLKQTQQ